MKSYPKIYAMGHRVLRDIPADHVVQVQEKVDGSQFRFWLNPSTDEVECFSKRMRIPSGTTDKLFAAAVEHVESKKDVLTPGLMMYGEVLSKPKHNTLEYDRTPTNHIVLFDAGYGDESYVTDAMLERIADVLEVDVIPVLFVGTWDEINPDKITTLLTNESYLGGPRIEGVVIKAYGYWGPDKKTVMVKHVSEAFKEKHVKGWKDRQPSRADIIDRLIAANTSEARWRKAIYRLRDEGKLENSPRDIGPLIAEIQSDFMSEEAEEIGRQLFAHFSGKINRGIIRGFPEWYKNELMERTFDV
jgi:hypothetical protein